MRDSVHGNVGKAANFARCASSLVLSVFAGLACSAGCGRSSLEEAPVVDGGTSADTSLQDGRPEGAPDGSPDGGACGPTSCPTGCCDTSGVCRVGTDLRACGGLGVLCQDCTATGQDLCSADRKACGRSVAVCDGTTCPGGCCVARPGGPAECFTGVDPTACGTGGAACVNCTTTGQSCDPRSRSCSAATKCDPTTCAGCCVGDQCLTGVAPTACGSKGGQCQNCQALGTTCDPVPGGGGACQGPGRCGPQNCGGCCDMLGLCTEGIDDTSCGRGGQDCVSCAPARVCAPRTQPNGRTCVDPPTCGPGNCNGCCDGNVCVPGTQNDACGVRGAQCQDCAAGGNICQAGVCSPGCGAANCRGCCQGNRCLPGFNNDSCGSGGAACVDCTVRAATCNTLANPRVCRR